MIGMLNLKSLSIFLVLSFLPFLASAVTTSETFPVRVLFGSDEEPPTTPVITTVVPDSPTQITVTWEPSTDNILLSGYRVFRDGSQVAVTTITSFVDTELLPETFYEYEIVAFDWLANVSTTSDAVGTTTLAVPVEEPPPVSTSTPRQTAGSQVVPQLLPDTTVTVQTTDRSATLDWQTFFMTNYVVRWGRTTAYEMGSIESIPLSTSHRTLITGLEPGTVYWFEIVGRHPFGREAVIFQGEFTTSVARVTEIPTNVNSFTAVAEGSDVRLRWDIGDSPTTLVRVLRNPLFFPQSYDDGFLVYEGTARQFLDQGALQTFPRQYYTIFISYNGVFSTGAVASVARTVIYDEETISDAEDGDLLPTLPEISIAPYDQVTADMVMLQQSFVRQTLSLTPVLNHYNEILVSIEATVLPRHLKSIIVTFTKPTDNRQVVSYLLKLNPAGTHYETIVPAPGVVGQGTIMVEIFDYELEVVRRIINQVLYVDDRRLTSDFGRYFYYGVIILLVTGTLFWFLVGRRRDDDEE